MRRRTRRAFSIVELLLVTVLMSIIAMVAYPALKSFSGRNRDANTATSVSRLINRVVDQARRRNRAYLLELTQHSVAQPQGLMTIRESTRPSCMLTTLDDTRILQAVPYGETVEATYTGDQQDDVGLAGWSRNGGQVVEGDLTLCVGPNGSLALGFGDNAQPLSGRLDIQVQRFELSAGSWETMGPARTVELTYAGGARLGLNR